MTENKIKKLIGLDKKISKLPKLSKKEQEKLEKEQLKESVKHSHKLSL